MMRGDNTTFQNVTEDGDANLPPRTKTANFVPEDAATKELRRSLFTVAEGQQNSASDPSRSASSPDSPS